MKQKIRLFSLLSIVFAVLLIAITPSYSQTCKIDKVENGDFEIKDAKIADEILRLIRSQDADNAENLSSVNANILKVDINNDGQEEYVVSSLEGTGHYLNWSAYTLDGKIVPDSFWGKDRGITESFLNAGAGSSTDIWITTVCGKNYFGYSHHDGSQQLYLIDSGISKACTPEWINYYKTSSDITDQWSSFCGTSFAQYDPTKSRDELIGYYSVSDACSFHDGYDEDALQPQIIIRPYQDKDLSVTIISAWCSHSGQTEQNIVAGVATYDPQHGFLIEKPLLNVTSPKDKEDSQKIYLVPERKRLVLEAITPGAIRNASWNYSQRKDIPRKYD